VIGASGLVGHYLYGRLQARGRSVCGTSHRQSVTALLPLDLRDADAVHNLLDELRPAVVYLPAAFPNVEYCETHPEETAAVNVEGTRVVAQAMTRGRGRLVFFSSDYVFDGCAGPYTEADAPNPICEYGRQKLAAERLVAELLPDSLIIRTTVVYGWERQGKNFVQGLLKRLAAGEPMRVPCDQVGSPTYAADLADAVIDLAERGATGIHNVVGPQRADRYEFAVAAARLAGLDPELITPVLTRDLGQVAARPLHAGLRTELAQATLGRSLIGYRTGLRHMLEARPQ
jgi:dTDP-4-dehydrorhamnose reductase